MADIERLPVGDSKELLLRRHTGARKVVSTRLARALATCCKFDTIDQHALRLARSGTAASEDRDPVGIVSGLIADGILVSEAEIVSLAQKIVAEQPETAAPIRSINFVTRDRVECFHRTAETHAENIRRFGREARMAVFDDSRDVATRAQYRRAVEEIQEKHGIPTQYVGAEEKNQLLQRLVGEGGVPEAVARFALFGDDAAGGTWGANRNAFLLHTAGQVALSVDDDVPCRVASAPERKPGLRLSSEHDPCEYWFYPTRDQALEGLRFEERDILSIHEELLGKRLAACIAENSNIQWDDNADIVALALNAEHARVLATVSGLAGDNALTFPRWLTLQGSSRERLVSDAAGYRSAFTSREGVRVVDRPTITSGSICIAACMGFDLRSLVPPFLPAGRASDGVFGYMIRHIATHSLLGHVPHMFLHAPPESRSYPARILQKDAASVRLCDVVTEIVAACLVNLPPADVSSRMRSLGHRLKTIAALEIHDFAARIRLEHYRQAGRALTQYQWLLQSAANTPPYWVHDVSEYAETLRASLLNDSYICPIDFSSREGGIEILGRVRELIRSFGDLLEWWPVMFAMGMNYAQRDKQFVPLSPTVA